MFLGPLEIHLHVLYTPKLHHFWRIKHALHGIFEELRQHKTQQFVWVGGGYEVGNEWCDNNCS